MGKRERGEKGSMRVGGSAQKMNKMIKRSTEDDRVNGVE